MRYVFHHEALAEYAAAVQYYAENRTEVAQAFIDAVEDAIYRIRESLTRWRVIDEDIRRYLTRKFPYGILYTVESEYILILAVMQCSRKPGYWKERTETKPLDD
ncbi:plasmid stabilization protein [cyanobacterium TDX16]|nr:plasmid stabilization protein [cyanobacterium TDX16]